MQNISSAEKEVTNTTFFVPELMIVPECLNLFFLISGVYGMYRGVEINHPLYAILFADMIVPMICSTINIFSFPFIPILKYVFTSNFSTVVCVIFHCSCWCVTSVIRYIYIVHESWLQRVLPNIRLQFCAAFVSTFLMTVCCIIPMFAYGTSLGE